MIPAWIDTVKGAVSGIFGKDGISGLIDNITTSKEEKLAAQAKLLELQNAFETKVQELALEREKAILADVADARASNVKIQGDKPGWMAKNVAYVLDLFIFAIWGAMTIYIICKFLNIIKAQQGVDFSGILGIYSGITAIAVTVLNFHRGSSVGSKANGDSLRKLVDKG